MKFSQLPSTTSVVSNALVAMLKAGKVYSISLANFLKDYYTKTEIDQKLANIQAGGSAFQVKVSDEKSVEADNTVTYTHNLANEFFSYVCFEEIDGSYVQRQTPLQEDSRTANAITLYSSRAIAKLKIQVIG